MINLQTQEKAKVKPEPRAFSYRHNTYTVIFNIYVLFAAAEAAFIEPPFPLSFVG